MINNLGYWSIILLPFAMAVAPALMNIILALLLICYLLKKILNKTSLLKTSLNLPLLCLFLLTCLSVVNSIDLKDTFKGGILRLLQYILVVFTLAESVKDKKHLRRIVFSIFAALLFVSLDAIWQILTGKDFVRGYPAIVNIGLVRATASFKDANILGIYLSGFAPLIFGLTLYFVKGRKKIYLALASLLVLGGVILTYSRPTLLAVYLALLFMGIVKKDKVMIALLALLLLVLPFIVPQSVKDFARELNYNPLFFMCNEDRVAIFRNTFGMVKAHPFVGVGANVSMKAYRYYKESPEFHNTITKDEMKAHNNFLQMAAEIGLVGLGIFLWFLFRLFSQAATSYRQLNDPYLKLITLSVAACLFAFLVNGLTESSLYYSRVALLFWYLCGLLLSLKRIKGLCY